MIVPLLAFTFMQITGTDFQTTLPIMLLVMLLMQNQTFIREHTSRAAINHVVSSSSPFGPITKELTTSFENPYNNPLVGAPASFNMGLEKASVNDVVDSPLPNEGLIRERDFMGATASNKTHGPSGVGWDLNSQ